MKIFMDTADVDAIRKAGKITCYCEVESGE